jgi:hypothetical protein
MLGRLPWLAFERRMRAFFFLVFFDMGHEVSGGPQWFLEAAHRAGQAACVQRSRSSAAQVLITRSIGTSHSAARLQP